MWGLLDQRHSDSLRGVLVLDRCLIGPYQSHLPVPNPVKYPGSPADYTRSQQPTTQRAWCEVQATTQEVPLTVPVRRPAINGISTTAWTALTARVVAIPMLPQLPCAVDHGPLKCPHPAKPTPNKTQLVDAIERRVSRNRFLVNKLEELLFKMWKIGITGKLWTAISRAENIWGHTRIPTQTMSGVPQGSVLGPLLFLIYKNDLPEVVHNSSTYLFADDTKLCKSIISFSDSILVQNDLDSLDSWCKEWKILLLQGKSSFMEKQKQKKNTILVILMGGE